MKRNNSGLRYFSMVLIVCGLILSVTGIGAFTTATSERQMSAAVSNDSAFLDIKPADPTVSQNGVDYSTGQLPLIGQNIGQNRMVANDNNSTQVTLGTLTNRFSSALTSIDVTVSEEPPGKITVRNPTVTDESIASGKSSQVTAIIKCDTTTKTTGTVNLSIEATGPSTSISTTQPVQITCVGQPSQTGAMNSTTQPLQP